MAVFPAQRALWEIKIKAPHCLKLDWLMNQVECEIEKSARGERTHCVDGLPGITLAETRRRPCGMRVTDPDALRELVTNS